jgi:hypothetical protein
LLSVVLALTERNLYNEAK